MAVELRTGFYLDGTEFAPGVDPSPPRRLRLQRGTLLVVRLRVTTPRGVPVDLSSASPVRLSVRKNPAAFTAPAAIQSVGAIPVGSPRGSISFTIAPEATANLPPGDYVWDVLAQFPGGAWETLVGSSPFLISP